MLNSTTSTSIHQYYSLQDSEAAHALSNLQRHDSSTSREERSSPSLIESLSLSTGLAESCRELMGETRASIASYEQHKRESCHSKTHAESILAVDRHETGNKAEFKSSPSFQLPDLSISDSSSTIASSVSTVDLDSEFDVRPMLMRTETFAFGLSDILLKEGLGRKEKEALKRSRREATINDNSLTVEIEAEIHATGTNVATPWSIAKQIRKPRPAILPLVSPNTLPNSRSISLPSTPVSTESVHPSLSNLSLLSPAISLVPSTKSTTPPILSDDVPRSFFSTILRRKQSHPALNTTQHLRSNSAPPPVPISNDPSSTAATFRFRNPIDVIDSKGVEFPVTPPSTRSLESQTPFSRSIWSRFRRDTSTPSNSSQDIDASTSNTTFITNSRILQYESPPDSAIPIIPFATLQQSLLSSVDPPPLFSPTSRFGTRTSPLLSSNSNFNNQSEYRSRRSSSITYATPLTPPPSGFKKRGGSSINTVGGKSTRGNRGDTAEAITTSNTGRRRRIKAALLECGMGDTFEVVK